MNRTIFFEEIKPNPFKKFTQGQVDNLNYILDQFEASTYVLSIPEMAYMLATAFHETATTMKPIEEYGKGKGKRYGTNMDSNGTRYKGLPHLYYGRGYVQLTWLSNYVKAKNELGVDFVNNPELALEPINAANIMIAGMKEGWFTGKKLSDYFDGQVDYVGARRIINGNDRASQIAGYARQFDKALLKAMDCKN